MRTIKEIEEEIIYVLIHRSTLSAKDLVNARDFSNHWDVFNEAINQRLNYDKEISEKEDIDRDRVPRVRPRKWQRTAWGGIY